MITWKPVDKIPELSYAIIGNIRVERLLIAKQNRFRYCIGSMETSLIKFDQETTLLKYLTI